MRKLLTRLFAASWMFAAAHVAHAELPEQIASVAPRAQRTLDARALKVSEKTGRVPVVLPDGKLLRFVPQSVRERQGVTTLRATIDGARLLLTTDGRNAFGFVATGSANYRITTVGGDTYVIDSVALPPPADVPLAPSLDDVYINRELVARAWERKFGRREAGNTLAEAPDAAHSVIDMAIFLDPELLEIHGPQVLRTMAQAYVDYTNEAFITNRINAELNLVLVEMYGGKVKLGDPFVDFYSDPNAFARGGAFGADLYHLLYFQRGGVPYCGMAGLIDSAGVTGFQCGERAFAHEVGHNFGANHDRNHAPDNVPPPLSDYNFGFVCGGDATIMSYVGAVQLAHYSDPTLFNNGEACGVAFDQPGGAHNAHVIEVMRVETETHRAPQAIHGTVSLASGALELDEQDAPVDITVTRDGDLSQAVSVEVAAIDDSADERRDYLPVLTRLEFAASESSKLVRIQPVDDQDYEEDEGFRLVLRYPLGLAVAGSAMTVTLHSDDPDLGKAVLATDVISASENGGPVVMTINRIGNATGSLTIQYSTADGTGTAGDSYQAVSGSLTFAPGETTKIVQVPIIDNIQWDPDGFRTFTFWLSGANLGEFAGANTTTTVKILNDDPNRGKAQFEMANRTISEAAGRIRVTVTRIGATESDLAVNYATSDGTARAGTDYTATSGSLVFAEGETSRVFEVPIRNNTVVDGVRSFTLTLTGDFLGTPTSATVNIGNDDQASAPEKKGGGGSLEAGSLLLLALLVIGRGRAISRNPRCTSAGRRKSAPDKKVDLHVRSSRLVTQ